MIPVFAQKVIDDYKQVSYPEWIENDFTKDILLANIYGNENSDFSPEFYEWYMKDGNNKIFLKKLKKDGTK